MATEYPIGQRRSFNRNQPLFSRLVTYFLPGELPRGGDAPVQLALPEGRTW